MNGVQRIPRHPYKAAIHSHGYGINAYEGDTVPDCKSKMNSLYLLIRSHTHTHTHIHMHTHTHVHIHIYIYTYIHIHTHTGA